MKKFYLLFLFCNLLIAQEVNYSFDTYTIYNNKKLFTNSSNQDYFMYLYYKGDKIIGTIVDLKLEKNHFFDVTKNNDDFSFTYIISNFNRYSNEKYFSSFYYEIKTIKDLENGKIIKYIIYKNKRKKKILKHFELELEKNDNNLFPAFRICFAHPYENFKRFNINENYLVKKVTLMKNNKSYVYLLEHYKKINLSLSISKIKLNS